MKKASIWHYSSLNFQCIYQFMRLGFLRCVLTLSRFLFSPLLLTYLLFNVTFLKTWILTLSKAWKLNTCGSLTSLSEKFNEKVSFYNLTFFFHTHDYIFQLDLNLRYVTLHRLMNTNLILTRILNWQCKFRLPVKKKKVSSIHKQKKK